jgi:glycerol-3-phosphate cytidylyltransferase-like family protein
VILTRDDQLSQKKGKPFMTYAERKEVLEAIVGDRGVVVPNVDTDITSVESIRKYRPDCFAKGGDTWDLDNLPEAKVCTELGIEVVFGVGGFDKVQSSSWLIKGQEHVK